MLVALLSSTASPHCISSCTYGRTDGLTQKVVSPARDISLADTREKAPKSVCICSDQRDSCPDNCLLRWF